MDNHPSKDQSFSEIMKKSKLAMPFSDFEERTMARINKENILKDSVSRYRTLAVFFFIIGTGFGFIITYFLSLPKAGIFGVPPDTILLVCRCGYVFLVLTQLNSILKLFTKPGYSAVFNLPRWPPGRTARSLEVANLWFRPCELYQTWPYPFFSFC